MEYGNVQSPPLAGGVLHPPQQAVRPSTLSRLSMVVLALIGLRLSWFFLRRILYPIFVPAGGVISGEQLERLRTVQGVFHGIEALLSLAALIAFLIWFHRFYAGLRARGAMTRFSPGLATGSWFIPFANLFLPYLAIRDGWRLVSGAAGGAFVLAWWLCVIVGQGLTSAGLVGFELSGTLGLSENVLKALNIASTTGWALSLVAWSLWGVLVVLLERRNNNGSA